MISLRAGSGSSALAGAAGSRTMMEAKKFPFDIRCSRRPQQPLHQPRRRQRFPLDVSAKATPPQPPIVRGAGGGGTSPSDDEDGEEEEEEAERERRRRSGAGSSSSSSPSSSSSSSSSPLPPKSRNDTMSLQARVAADVLGVVHPARRNLTFSRALDSLTASSLEAYCCGWTESDLDRELARAHAREREAPKPAVAASYVLLVWLTAEAAAEALGGNARSALGLSRWSPAPAVSERSRRRWAGFAKLIVDAYYKKSWAWYPIEALALEMSAAAPAVQPRGRRRQENPNAASDDDDEDNSFPSSPSSDDLIFASSPADVAEWARVVYATLDLLGRRGEGKRRF